MSIHIILDNHMHLRRDGLFLDAVREFKKYGGTHLILCQYPLPEKVIKERSYTGIYRDTLEMAKEVTESTGVKVFVTVGPYPVDYLFFRERLGREKSLYLMKKGMDEAATLCLNEEICVGIGEIGRPHFDVKKEILEDSNEILFYGMEVAKDNDLPVILHTEKATPEVYKSLRDMANRAGISLDKVIKHFSPPFILPEENYGLMPSVLATKKNITLALQKGSRFLMETDYIDDPSRPGAVLSLKTVPRNTIRLLKNGIMDEDQAYEIHKDLPERIYKIYLD